MNLKTTQIWIYDAKGTRYYIEEIGEMKILDGEWIPSVTYSCLLSGKIYTRDLETFHKKFSLDENSLGEPIVKISSSKLDLVYEERAELRIRLKEKDDEIHILKQCLDHDRGFAQGLIDELKAEIESLKKAK